MWKATRRDGHYSVPADHRFGARLSGGIHVTGKSRWRYQERAARTRGVRRRFRMAVRGELVMGQIWPTSDEYAYL